MKTRATIFASVTLVFMLLLSASACGGGGNPFGLRSQVVTPADQAAAMVFAPDGRLFYGEQFTGNIRVINPDGQLQAEPFATLNVAVFIEWGLTGLALDPDFEENRYVYAYYTEPVQEEPPIAKPVVVRFTDRDSQGVERKVIVGDLPETAEGHEGINANGRVHFGPDGFLYISLGDYDIRPPGLAQDLSSPVGKLLRVKKEDGSPAPGNPFLEREGADPRIFAYGFREPFDFIFHPQSKTLYGTDNTPVTCEELNVIEPGDNFGWPDVGEFPFSDCAAGEQKEAIYLFAKKNTKPQEFLSLVFIYALDFASAEDYPTVGDSLVVCEAGTGLLRRLTLSGSDFVQVTDDDVMVKDCKLEVTANPGGTLFYSNETEIRRLIPEEQPGR